MESRPPAEAACKAAHICLAAAPACTLLPRRESPPTVGCLQPGASAAVHVCVAALAFACPALLHQYLQPRFQGSTSFAMHCAGLRCAWPSLVQQAGHLYFQLVANSFSFPCEIVQMLRGGGGCCFERCLPRPLPRQPSGAPQGSPAGWHLRAFSLLPPPLFSGGGGGGGGRGRGGGRQQGPAQRRIRHPPASPPQHQPPLHGRCAT